MTFKNLFNKKKSSNYRLPEGYEENSTPVHYTDNTPIDNVIYQPHIYETALYFAKRSNIKTIINIGSENGLELIPFLKAGYYIICIDIDERIKRIKNNLSDFTNITYKTCDLSHSFPSIDKCIISDSIVISTKVIEHIVNIDIFFKWLAKISFKSKYLLISTPNRDKTRGYGNLHKPKNLTHVREWNANEFKLLLNDYSFSFNFLGHTVNTNHYFSKDQILVIGGKEIAYKKTKKQKSILAIINVYNEEDIIIESVEHLLSQGLDVYIYDDNSTDDTYKILLKKYKHNKRIYLMQRKDTSNNYNWELLLKHTEEVANEFQYDWFMHCDADEIRYSPWRNIILQDAITFIDNLGYNAIDFTVLDFRFSDQNKNISSNFENNLLSFEFGKRAGHFSQIKLWKKQKTKIDLHSSGGHEAKFENRKIYPVKFLLKHYPLRNITQMNKKIFADRENRIKKEQNSKGWHTQYNDLINQKKITKLPWEEKHLLSWNSYIIKDDFLIELISGIGLGQKS